MDFSTPRIMGIVNLTPDSFFGGSRFQAEKEILSQVEKMLEQDPKLSWDEAVRKIASKTTV